MIGTFLDKLQGLFDVRFVVACWMPMAIGIGSAVNLLLFYFGYMAWIDWWFRLDASRQLWATAGALVITTILAFVLQSFSTPLVRIYAGFNWPGWLRRPCIAWQRRTYRAMAKRQNDRGQLYAYFPENDTLMQPTALGNRLQAADEHAYRAYNLDSAVWWPRLTVVLPDAFRRQIDGALTPMLALLNICTLLVLVSLLGGPLLLRFSQNWILALALIGGQLVFAALCYWGSLSQVLVYGAMVRTGFDLYRHEVLRQLHIAIPESLVAERQLWPILTDLYLFGDMPWSASAEPQGSPPQHVHYPFYFDTHKPPTSPQPDRIELKITEMPVVVLQQQGPVDPRKDS